VQTSNACDPYLAAGVETPATRIARACVAPSRVGCPRK
jgi:hypothetical protein